MSTKSSVKIEIIELPIGDIKPYWKNPRINKKSVEALIEIIPVVGFNVPLVLDRNNEIIKGHTRYKAARALSMKTLPCIYSDNDAATNRLDRITDNRVFELSRWNFEEAKITDFQRDKVVDIINKTKKQMADADQKYTVVCPYCGEGITIKL